MRDSEICGKCCFLVSSGDFGVVDEFGTRLVSRRGHGFSDKPNIVYRCSCWPRSTIRVDSKASKEDFLRKSVPADCPYIVEQLVFQESTG